MNKYTFEFYGRFKNAIGIDYRHTAIVKANTEQEARLKLYDTHEHIHMCKLVRFHASGTYDDTKEGD